MRQKTLRTTRAQQHSFDNHSTASIPFANLGFLEALRNLQAQKNTTAKSRNRIARTDGLNEYKLTLFFPLIFISICRGESKGFHWHSKKAKCSPGSPYQRTFLR